MTMMLNTASPAAPAKTAQASAPADQVVAAAPAAPAIAPGAAQPSAAQPFMQWMGSAADAQPASQPDIAPDTQLAEAALPALTGDAGAAPAKAADTAKADAAADDDSAPVAAQPDGALLAAMAMPLMPLSPAQLVQALQAAQGKAPQSGDAKADAADAADARATAPAVAAAGQADARRAALAQPVPPALAQIQQPLAAAPSAQPAPRPAPQPAQQPAQHEADAAAVRVAVQGANQDSAAKDRNTDGGNPQAGANAQGAAAQFGALMAAAPAVPQRAADTVALAGPPTAWRQSLQEALGERLQLQVGNNMEQAVIRLEPPQLGQIDIAIRHSAGSLEVNISASNSEVLRQLQTVSDNLKSDLSQRQFSEVAVTVSPAQKNNAAPFGDPQQQGRGRQQGRDQDESEPGRALAEAGNPASVFSLGGRDRA
jgi:flagellar hook-length control protein FliK